MLTLEAKKRDIFGKQLQKARADGKMPVVIYGGKGEKGGSFFVEARDFKKVWGEAGESTLVTLQTPEGDKDTLIHEASFHPTTGEPVHADFYVVDTSKPIEIKVPLVFEGVPPAVKNLGGILLKVLHEMHIEALPKNLPREIKVDLAVLENLDSHILVKDLKLPAGVTSHEPPEEIVASIAVAKEEVEEVAPADLSAIEVEKKGKEEVEGEAPTQAEGGGGVPTSDGNVGKGKKEAKGK